MAQSDNDLFRKMLLGNLLNYDPRNPLNLLLKKLHTINHGYHDISNTLIQDGHTNVLTYIIFVLRF